jgi:cell division protein FtsW (lipid II flippase)
LASIHLTSKTDQTEGRLLILAALFLALYGAALSLAPLVRARSLQASPDLQHWLEFAVWGAVFYAAHLFSTRRLPQRNPLLLPAAALLSGWGLLTIDRLLPEFGLRQAVWLFASGAVLIAGFWLPQDFGFLRRYKYLWLSGGLVLTALTLFLGTNPLGAGPKMWLGCCGLYLQPSEPLKLLLIIYLAAYLADRMVIPGEESQKWTAQALLPLLAPTLVMTALALLLLAIQRDLGTASIFLFLYAVMVYIASGRRRVALIAVVALIAASVGGYLLFDVVRLRIDAWLNPWLDPSGRSYQIVQSLLAVANGGLVGRGPGLGNPGVVPVPHSDFIFAAIFEETGLVGAIGIFVLVALIGYAGLRSAMRTTDPFKRYLAAGLTAYLVGQSILIIAGNLRLLPLTGVTLPFVSYGGSSLLISMISLLFLMVISTNSPNRKRTIQETRPVLQLGALLLVGIAGLAMMAGWWTVVRGPALLTRTDNPRRTINDLYVRRGSILDRKDRPINQTQGVAGEYTRQSLYPDLSPIIGYTDPTYGQAGLEASLDGYLRGVQGNPLLSIWWSSLIYGQPPPGLDIRTSLDLDLQATADRLLQDHTGALVLLNADTGEILAMSSHPTFNANRLAELGENYLRSSSSPLLNRATQGLYPLGAALGGPLMAQTTSKGNLPEFPIQTWYSVEGDIIDCAELTSFNGASSPENWAAAIGLGCPRPVAALGDQLGSHSVIDFYSNLGLYSTPRTNLTASSSTASTTGSAADLALGAGQRASPLQISLAAAVLSANGVRPAPKLATAVNEPERGWVILNAQETSRQVLPEAIANATADALVVPGRPYWQTLAIGPEGNQKVTWYLGGTLPDWNGTPLALAVLLEENNSTLAEEIGQKMLSAGIGQ